MAKLKFDKEITALLVIDPYNDFISEGGKVWDRLKTVAEANGCVPHMLQVLNAARKAGLRVFYALHHRYRPGDYESWKYIAPRTGLGTELSHSRRRKMNLKLLRFFVVSLAAAMSLTPPAAVLAQQLTAPKAKNVVLVHGLFADGSSWSQVIRRLQAAGVNVTSVQNHLTKLPEAVYAALRVLRRTNGPTVL